jgi:hypothetical protein
MSPGPTMPAGGEGKKFIKPINLSRRDIIIPMSQMTRERCVIQDKFKDVLTAAVNAEHKGFLVQLVMALKDGIPEKMIKTLNLVVNREAAIGGAPEAAHIVEFLIGVIPKPDGLSSEEFTNQILEYLQTKNENESIMMQVFRDVYESERGRKKGILNEVLMEGARLLAEQEDVPPSRSEPTPQQRVKDFIIDNLKESSAAQHHNIEHLKITVGRFWPGMRVDLSKTELFQKIGGKPDKLDPEQVVYWHGNLGLTVTGGNDSLWFDFYLKDRTKEVAVEWKKDTERWVEEEKIRHEEETSQMEAELARQAAEANQGPQRPDDSKRNYGASHRLSSHEPVLVPKINLNVRANITIPEPEVAKNKFEYEDFIYSKLPEPDDPKFKLDLAIDEMLVGTFTDSNGKLVDYFVRTRAEFKTLVKSYKLKPEKLRICKYDAALRNALPVNVRNITVETVQTFLTLNRGKNTAILETLKDGKPEGVVTALKDCAIAPLSPNGKFIYDLRYILQKVLLAKQGFQTQQKTLADMMPKIKPGYRTPPPPTPELQAQLVVQAKKVLLAKQTLQAQLAPLAELISKAYQVLQIQPTAQPQPAPQAQQVLPWESLVPWNKIKQIIESGKSGTPGVSITIKIPEAFTAALNNRNVTDQHVSDMIKFLRDTALELMKETGAKMAANLADNIAALNEVYLPPMLDAFARLAGELSQLGQV